MLSVRVLRRLRACLLKKSYSNPGKKNSLKLELTAFIELKWMKAFITLDYDILYHYIHNMP